MFESLQVDEARAENVEPIVVRDAAIPEELFVGRTFLDLPHLSLLRINNEFFVGPTDVVLERIRGAPSTRPRASRSLELQPGTAGFVEARTKPDLAVIVRAPECDFVFHSDERGTVRLPVENTSLQPIHFRPGDQLGSCRILAEEELRADDLPELASTVGQVDQNSVVVFNNVIGCQRKIAEEEVLLGPSLIAEQRADMMELINEFRDVFSFSLRELGCTRLLEADIELQPGKTPLRVKPYRLASEDREFMENQIRE